MSLELARASTSSSDENRVIAAMGPKFSSAITAMSSVQPVRTVGSKKCPALKPVARAPPVATLAPAATAPETIFSISANRKSVV